MIWIDLAVGLSQASCLVMGENDYPTIQHALIVSSTCPGVLLLQPSVGVQQRDLCTQAAAGKQCPWPNNHPLSPGFGSYIHSAFHGIFILPYLTPFTLPELLDLSYNVSKCHKPHPNKHKSTQDGMHA